MSEPGTNTLSLAVVGSRKFSALQWVEIHLQGFREHFYTAYDRLVIVSGGGGNVDLAAETISRKLGLDMIVYRAQWDKYGPSAGPKRNALIVASCDRLVAFWDGRSKGTLDSMRKAKDAGKPVLLVTQAGAFIDWNEDHP